MSRPDRQLACTARSDGPARTPDDPSPRNAQPGIPTDRAEVRPVAATPSTAGTSPAAPRMTAAGQPTLDETFRATLARSVHGLCFSPYTAGQQPGDPVSESQIRQRLAIVRPYTRWIRTFSCTDGHEHTPRLARQAGLKTLVGAWLGTVPAINQREIDGVIAVARAGHADLVAVGNEVLLRGDLDEDTLVEHILRVKDAVPGVPVGYVDAHHLFARHPRVTAACDVVMANCYPFWEGSPIDRALPHMQAMLESVRAVAGGKRVLISETGWPDRGSTVQGAVPGRSSAMRSFIDTAQWAEPTADGRPGIEWFHFAAFDEAWKVDMEGDVGAAWGLWDADGRLKFGTGPED